MVLHCIYAEIGCVRQRLMHCLVDPYMVFCIFVCEIIQVRSKVHLHRIFGFRFFSSKARSWSPDSFSRLFFNINSNSPRYSNSKVIQRISRIRGKKFFCHARAISKVVPLWLYV
jgi:hypothetical protein